MSLSRQQKRATLRRLNDPKSHKKIIERNQKERERELELIRNSKKRKLAVVAIAILTGLIVTAIIFG